MRGSTITPAIVGNFTIQKREIAMIELLIPFFFIVSLPDKRWLGTSRSLNSISLGPIAFSCGLS